MPLTISIALCTCNGEQYLSEQLNSIYRQTLSPTEIVICDDNSTDSSVEILQQFRSRMGCPVRIVQNVSRLGAAQNFEKAISLCSGEIIVLCDQDDVWLSNKLEIICNAFEANPQAAYVFSDAEFVNPDGSLQDERLWDAVQLRDYVEDGTQLFDHLLRHNLIPGSSMAIRSSLRDYILPIPSDWMHDYWMVLVGLLQAEAVALPYCLYHYRRHPAQVCGWRKRSFSDLICESFATNEEGCQQKVEMWEKLRLRIESRSHVSDIAKIRLFLMARKQRHLAARHAIRSLSGLRPLTYFLQELFSGRYLQFSNSWRSIIRDLVSVLTWKGRRKVQNHA